MKYTILANIGNRNLTYQGTTLLPDNRSAEPQLSFRQLTQQLLDQYELIKNELNEQILSVLLRDIGADQIEKVVLFASDNQIEGDRNDQDTIHEAHILQHLFTERLGLVVDVAVYTQNVTHNDELLRFYRNALRSYQQTDSEVIICDAGGTAQQKSALKIAAEYLLDPAHFSVRYVLPSGKLTTVDQVEYRRVIDQEHVAALVDHGQYAGALTIYKQLSQPNSEVLALLNLLRNRSELFWADAQAYVTDTLKTALPALAGFKGGKALGNYELVKGAISSKGFLTICERLEVAHLRWLLGDWTRAVLGFSVVIESIVNEVIQQQGRFMLVQQYPKDANALLETIQADATYSDILTYFGGKVLSGLPLHLRYAQKITTYPLIQTLLMGFEPLNSRTNGSNGKRGLDCLRNELTHKGKSVKPDELLNHAPMLKEVIEDTRQKLGFPTVNTYLTLHQLLTQRLRQ